jgi:hypothetical protein
MACKVARERTSNAPNAAARYLCATLSNSFPGILQLKITLQTRHWSRGPLSGNCFAIQINVRFARQKQSVAITLEVPDWSLRPHVDTIRLRVDTGKQQAKLPSAQSAQLASTSSRNLLTTSI